MNRVMERCSVRLALLVGIALLLGRGGLARAEQSPSELEMRMEKSSQLVERLSERLGELEKKLAQGQAAAASAPPAPAESSLLDEVTWLHGFADVNLIYSGRREENGQRRKGFNVGALDLYLTPSLGSHVKSLAELIFEVNDEGETMAELERLQIGYAFGDYLTIWGGRFHTPLGYWNTAFHHGKQIQTSIARPKFLDFEEDGGIIPTHMVGLWGAGAARLGGGTLSYDLYLANGPRIKGEAAAGEGELNPNTFSADNYAPAAGLHLAYEPAAFAGLKLGVHLLHSTVDGFSEQGTRITSSQLNVMGGYGAYLSDDWEVIGEFYQFLNRDETGGSGSHASSAGFLQAGRVMDRFTPYARFEFASLSQRDLYFSQLAEGRSYRRALAGVRFDVTPKAALKLEASHTRNRGEDRDDYFVAASQFAIRF